ERAHEMRERERQATLGDERHKRVADAVDNLTEALNGYVTVVMAGLDSTGVHGANLAPYVEKAHRAIGVLERDGPPELLDRLFEINDHIAAENSERRTNVY